MKKKSLFLFLFLFLVLLAVGIFRILRPSPPPQLRAADRFLSALSEGRDVAHLMASGLSKHPFLALMREKKGEGFTVDRLEPVDKEHARVRISVLFPDGTVQTALDMRKQGQQWMITGLPETAFHTHGIPIAKTAGEKNRVIWAMDTGDKIVEGNAPSSVKITEGQPVSFRILDGMLIDIRALEPVALTRVMSLSDTILEDRELGYFDLQGDFPVFQEKDGKFVYSGPFRVPIGATHVTLYRTPDRIGRMAILSGREPISYDRIRVALQNSEYSCLLHPRIEITCAGDYTVRSLPNSILLHFSGGETAEFLPNGKETTVRKNGQVLDTSIFRWIIEPQGKEPLQVKSIQRSRSAPSSGTPYRGILEATAFDGQLVLINEVGLEEYLYSVVPSEMPVKFGLEALKVQAVAARSYAVRAMDASGYRAYGAHLDDSTASQVYNNVKEQEVAVQAVTETAGTVAVYGEEIVDTRFFSTSWGYTANFHEVWSSRENEFPSTEIPYLTANPQYAGNTPDLQHEENFHAFLDQTDLPGYDRFSPFFRWSVTMTRAQLEASLKETLPELYRQQPLFVLTKGPAGKYRSAEIPADIGTLLNIEVLRRGEGGNIMELEITTTHGVFRILKEYNIRQALKPVNCLGGNGPMELKCHDGTVYRDFSLLPSAFACIDFQRDNDGNIRDILIRGGGYGHGVGMSQYGTYGLTLMGKSWQEIIGHYYPGSELKKYYGR